MKHTIISACFVLIFPFSKLFGQAENNLKTLVDSTELMIRNGKKKIEKNISEKKYTKARETYNYVNTISSQKNIEAFDYSEEIIINLILCNWQKVKYLLENYSALGSIETFLDSKNSYPIFFQHVKIQSDSLSVECENSDLDTECIDLIQTMLYLCKSENPDSKYSNMLNRYHEKHKSERFQDITLYYLPKEISSLTVDFILGSGLVIPTGKLADRFNPGLSFNISLDFIYKKLYSSFYLNIAGIKLKESFENRSQNDTLYFKKDDPFFFFDGGLKAGYLITNNKNKRFGPYISISGTFLESNLKEEETDPIEFRVFGSSACGIGVTSEFIFEGKPEAHSNNYFGLKFDLAYNFIWNTQNTNFTGNLPYINIGFIYGYLL